MVSNSLIEELNYYAVHNVIIAHDDDQIEAHKIWSRKQSKCEVWHPATVSGILLQIQASGSLSKRFSVFFYIMNMGWPL